MEHESVQQMWKGYLESIGENQETTNLNYTSWHFCDNEQDANELASLVLQGTKRATASLSLFYENDGDEMPLVGDLSIIINWEGVAQCIIKTTNIDLVPYKEVTEEFAATEGEGDKSLNYWRRCHWDYFSRELQEIGKTPDENMLVICEKFEVVYKN